MGDVLNILLLQNTLRTATPVVLAALGVARADTAGFCVVGMC